MAYLTAQNDGVIKGLERRRLRYAERNEAINRWYSFYFVEDKLLDPPNMTLATPDSRTAVDLGIYILCRNEHIDTIPASVQDKSQRDKMNMGERFLAGQWRLKNWEAMQQGLAWHQRRLAAWMLMTGWYCQYTALLPGADGKPEAFADLWDPAGVYPEWGGPRRLLRAVDHEFLYDIQSLREMADHNGWNGVELSGSGETLVTVLDHWESRYNRESPGQPDILNSVYVGAATQQEPGGSPLPGAWQRHEWMELQPVGNRTTDSKRGGFVEVPVLISPVGGVELSAAYAASASQFLAKMGQGLLAPVEEVQNGINRQISALLQMGEIARVAATTPVITSPSGDATLEPSEMGKAQSLRTNESITYPHALVRPDLASFQVIISVLGDLFQRSTFPWTQLGQTSFTLSGVAIERLNESSRSHLEAFHRAMRFIYEQTGHIWLRDYRRRWEGKKKYGAVRLQGVVNRTGLERGYFDQEFLPSDIPETHFLQTDIPWGLVEDDMMKANIARALWPTGDLLSRTTIRSRILKVQDEQLEERLIASDRKEDSPVWQNAQLAFAFLEEMKLAMAQGEPEKAELWARMGDLLLQSLAPAQGRGIPGQPGQGSPEAGGNMANVRGSRPELALANAPRAPAEIAAPAGGGAMGQAERNV